MTPTLHTVIYGVALILATAEALIHRSLTAGALAFISLGLLVQA